MWANGLRAALKKEHIRIRRYRSLTKAQRSKLDGYFAKEVFPLCTPLLLHPSTTFPFISNRSLNLAIELKDGKATKVARVKVPTVLPRFIPVPERPGHFLLLEDLIAANLPTLFPGVEVVGSNLFRVIRDADVEIRELEAADLITAVEKSLRLRRFGDPVLLETQPCSGTVLDCLKTGLELDQEDVLIAKGMLGFEALWELTKLDLPALKYEPFFPEIHERLSTSRSLFEYLSENDLLVSHPYDSFQPIELFASSIVTDPAVMGIKQTLYRVGSHSPVVESLLAGAEQGKQVAVVVELKARFDESNNLVWARALERAGAHLSYGFPEMKTHCKLCLLVRREEDGIARYAHVGTGNYNPNTARLYTDFGLFTRDPEICQDVGELFNYLTGVSRQIRYRKLLVAPLNLREEIIARIDREKRHAQEGKRAHIVFKLNSLVDPEVIDALYSASRAGVPIDLVVRGICCLRPGVRRQSDTVRVVSIVGRFLEHNRAYYFENDGSPELFIGSADMMRRNLDRRIEVLVPVQDPAIVAHVREVILESSLRDNLQAWNLTSSGSYVRSTPGREAFDSQRYLMQNPSTRQLVPAVQAAPPVGTGEIGLDPLSPEQA